MLCGEERMPESSHARRARSALVGSALLLVAVLASACADEPRIWFENQREDVVTVSVDGDRLLIIRPHTGQYLTYNTAAWAWPRRIDVATRDGRPLWSQRLDADELSRQAWIVRIP
jgi:hypothetical protein